MSSHPRRHLPTPSHHITPIPQPSDSNVRLRWPEYAVSAAATTNVPQRGFGLLDEPYIDPAERKRRYIGLEHDRRTYQHPVFDRTSMSGRISSEGSLSQATSGTSRASAIDFTTPPRPFAMPREQPGEEDGNNSERRRESDIRVPPWQPDGMVSKCPVCQTNFNIFYRKHHCRKCGRVVCGACSPHRITIPRQYIVQQPSTGDVSPSQDDEQASPVRRNPALGGGEIVRVCNPCVPDPWTPPAIAASNSPDAREPAHTPTLRHLQREAPVEQPREPREVPERYRWNPPPPQVPIPGGRHRSWSQQAQPRSGEGASSGPLFGPSSPLSSSLRESHTSGPPLTTPRQPAAIQYGRGGPFPAMLPPPLPSSSSRPSNHRHSQSSSEAMMDSRRMYRLRNPNWRAPPSNNPGEGSGPLPPPGPKREIKEEDECPVCGIELVPDEQVRERHVQECISARFSTGATPPSTAPIATTGTGDVASSNTYPAVRTAAPTASSFTAPNRPRATSYRPRGMAVYTATEKDCTNADGEAQECVICFEEFQPGDELGRMECLCKFHRKCIRSWWERKGGGSCPTHQLQE